MNGLAERDHVRIADNVRQRLQVGVTLSIFAEVMGCTWSLAHAW